MGPRVVFSTMRGLVSGGVYAAHGAATARAPAQAKAMINSRRLIARPLTARSDDDSGDRTAGLRRRQMTPSTKK